MACYMQTNKKQNTKEKKNAIRMVNKKSHRPPCESDHFKNKKKGRKGNCIGKIKIIIIFENYRVDNKSATPFSNQS